MRELARRSGYPTATRRVLVKMRKQGYDLLQTLLAPGKNKVETDNAVARIFGMTVGSAKQIRYGNRSLSEEEWISLVGEVRDAAGNEQLLVEAVNEFEKQREAFMRPYADELDAKSSALRRGNALRSEVIVRPPQGVALHEESGSVHTPVEISIGGSAIYVPPGKSVRIDVSEDSVTCVFPRCQ